VPTRPRAVRKAKRGPGAYRQAKRLRIYLLDGDERIVHLPGRHQIQTPENFSEDLARVAERIEQDKVRIALLADRAEFFWKAMTACFPNARQVLDFYHCAEHIHTVARAQYEQRSLKALELAEATLVRLSMGEIQAVIGALKRMNPRNSAAGAKLSSPIRGAPEACRERRASATRIFASAAGAWLEKIVDL